MMKTKGTKTTFEDMIRDAFNSNILNITYGRNNKERQAAAKDLIKWFENHYIAEDKKNGISSELLTKDEGYILTNIDSIMAKIIERMRSYANNKSTIAGKLEYFLKYLKKKYNLSIDLKPLDNFKDNEKIVQRIKILKHLHSRGKTRSQIAEDFGISERTLSNELNILHNGIDFLGFEIKMGEIERKENTYRSLVHPIFYAAHMSEIYSLTIGLKLLSKGTIFEHTLSPIADKIYQQLTEHAKEIIDHHSELNELYFEGQPLRFMNTSDMLLQDKPFTYYLKDIESKTCKVFYYDKDGLKNITGTLHLSESKEDRFKKLIVKTATEDIELDIKCISSIKELTEE